MSHHRGPLAQLGERLVRNQEVGGSIPPRSTKPFEDQSLAPRLRLPAIRPAPNYEYVKTRLATNVPVSRPGPALTIQKR